MRETAAIWREDRGQIHVDVLHYPFTHATFHSTRITHEIKREKTEQSVDHCWVCRQGIRDIKRSFIRATRRRWRSETFISRNSTHLITKTISVDSREDRKRQRMLRDDGFRDIYIYIFTAHLQYSDTTSLLAHVLSQVLSPPSTYHPAECASWEYFCPACILVAGIIRAEG